MSSSSSDLASAPVYAEMVDDILADIANGRLRVGQRLASEVKLKQQYGISINSIKRGLGLLVERGVLRRRRGSGTFVARRETSVADTLVRRDAVAVLQQIRYWRYHPFFSAQLRGITAGLGRHGWRTVDLQFGDEPGTPPATDSSFRSLTAAMAAGELERHPAVAGVICVQGAAATARALAAMGHAVVYSGPSKYVPYVCYDWPLEMAELFRLAICRGRRRLLAVSTMSESQLQAMCRRGCQALGLAPDAVHLTCLCGPHSTCGAELVSRAYRRTLERLGNGDAVDGLIVTSDFEAQGVTDALVSLSGKHRAEVAVFALLNKESRLRAQVPLTALVCDGHACGVAMAELMHDQLTGACHLSAGMTMRCHQVEWR